MRQLSAPHLIAMLALALPLASCSSAPQEEEPERALQELTLGFSQSLVTPTSLLRFDLPDDPRFASKSASVRLQGRIIGGQAFEYSGVALVSVDERDDAYLELDVSRGLFAAVPEVASGPIFEGRIIVEVLDLRGPFARGETEALLEFDAKPEPVVQEIERAPKIYPGQLIKLSGRGFLRPEEGTTYAVVESGAVTVDRDMSTQDVRGRRLPLQWSGERSVAYLPAFPHVFGLHPGRFEGTFSFVNELRDGVRISGSEQVSLSTRLDEPFIESVSPLSGSRSQIISIKGRGFLPGSQEFNFGMYLRYEGGFTPAADPTRTIDYRAQRAIERSPFRVLGEREVEQDIWYTVDAQTRRLSGLGAAAGVFDGRVVPVILYGGEQEVGRGISFRFRVLPTTQIVHVRFLPSFGESLSRFGLRNVEPQVRARIFEVLRRDYKGVNVQFVDTPPSNFNDFMTLEIGGPDPTGQNLLGYDNSFNGVPKDTGNLFLRDYLGGYNRQSKDANFSAYGGVFIESFVVFSPTITPNSQETTAVFDSIMGKTMPELGGSPVSATEWPDGPRTDSIMGAILLIGNLAGHTAVHEIGHSLGLPYVEGEDPESVLYHNEDEGKPYIMDPGISRPFEERAEIGGQGPSIFSPANRAYLERILPE